MKNLLIRCDGGHHRGMGHVVRCLAIADELRAAHDWKVHFAMKEDEVSCRMVREAGYEVGSWNSAKESENIWLQKLVAHVQPNVLLLDIRTDLSASDLMPLRQKVRIVALEDFTRRRLAAHLAIYPPLPQVKGLDWEGYNGRLLVGWDWIIMRSEFKFEKLDTPENRSKLLITMGGSDPAGLTQKTLNCFREFKTDLPVAVVIGPNFCYDRDFQRLVDDLPANVEICRNADMFDLMRRSILAVTSFGFTSYELALAGVPAIYLCLTEDHALSATAMVEAGFGQSLGLYSKVTNQELQGAVEKMLQRIKTQHSFTAFSKGIMDGQGTARVARAVVDVCEN